MGKFNKNSKAPAKTAGNPTKKSLPPFKGMKKNDTSATKIIKKEKESSSSDEEEENAMDVSINQQNDSSSNSSSDAEEIVDLKKSIVKKNESSAPVKEDNSKPVPQKVNLNNNTNANKKTANVNNDNQFHANYSLMLSNLDSGSNPEELRQFLINKGIPVEGFHFITTPVAILQIPTITDMDNIRTKLQGMKYKTKELCCVKVDGNVSRMILNKTTLAGTIRSKNVIFVSRIPADISKADIKKFLPDIDDSTYTLLIAYHKVKKNIAVSVKITFDNENDAKTALTNLQGKELRGQKLSATYSVEKPNQVEKNVKDLPANEDLRGKTMTLLVRNLPSTSNYAKMKTIFPSGVRFEIIKRNSQSNNCFVQFPDVETCSTAFDEYQDKEIEGQAIRISFVPTKGEKKAEVTEDQLETQLKISNLPFSKTHEDLVKEFPTAATVFLKTNNMKKSIGSCILTFNSKEDCVAVFNACKKKAIEGRPLRCEPWSEDKNNDQSKDSAKNNSANNQFAIRLFNLPFEATFKDIKKCFPNSVRVTVLKDAATGKPRGMAVVNFNSNAECEEALKKCPTSMIGGRKIRGERQVDVKAGDKLALAAEKKSKNEQQIKSKEVASKVVPQTKKVKNEPEKEEDDDEESGEEEEEEEESSDEEIVKPGVKRSFKEIGKSAVVDSKKAKITAKPTESSDDDDDEESDAEDDDDSDD